MKPTDKAHILIVDDQPSKLLSLEAILCQLGEPLIKANSADQALRVLLSHEISIVLMDICMPGMDGFELAELIRQHPRYQSTAIIFISGVHLSGEDCLRGYSLGAVDYITTPIIPEVLRAKVAVFVELYRKTVELEWLNRDLEQRVAQRTADLEASYSRLRQSEQRYRDFAHGIPVAVYMTDAEGRITLYNQAAAELWGSKPRLGRDRWCGSLRILKPDESEMPYDDSPMAVKLREGRTLGVQELILERPDRSRRRIVPHTELMRGEDGGIVGAVVMLVDVTEQRAAQEVLARDRETLERLIAKRTEELERSSERLRLNERMATIGTLSAGLGHDMGNLLLPIRMHLDTIESRELPTGVRESVAAVRTASEYLQQLAKSLRLLAIDPESEEAEGSVVDLAEWWNDAEVMIRNGVQRPTVLKAEIPPGLPPVRMGKAALTQAVFNVVQNAGDALQDRAEGAVLLQARADGAGRAVSLTITDNGPGMTEQARMRCTEPFYTTKTRGLSTGLGLALVSGLVKRCGGTLQIQSQPGSGTAVTLTLPVLCTAARTERVERANRRRAKVTVANERLRAHVDSVLLSLNIAVDPTANGTAEIWVLDAPEAATDTDVQGFLAMGSDRRVLVCCRPPEWSDTSNGLLFVDGGAKPSVFRRKLAEAIVGAPAALPEEFNVH